jgi:hypothetical protein
VNECGLGNKKIRFQKKFIIQIAMLFEGFIFVETLAPVSISPTARDL